MGYIGILGYMCMYIYIYTCIYSSAQDYTQGDSGVTLGSIGMCTVLQEGCTGLDRLVWCMAVLDLLI